jgi:hypothetical protein
VTVSWFVPQNQVGFDLSVAPQNRRSKSGSVSQTVLKTSGAATTGGARGAITEVTSEAS